MRPRDPSRLRRLGVAVGMPQARPHRLTEHPGPYRATYGVSHLSVDGQTVRVQYEGQWCGAPFLTGEGNLVPGRIWTGLSTLRADCNMEPYYDRPVADFESVLMFDQQGS